MLRLLCIPVLLMCLPLTGSAQGNPTLHDRLSLHVAPLSLLDPFARLRVGLDYQHSASKVYTLDIGYGRPWLDFVFTEFNRGNNYSIYEIRPEVKFLLGGYFEGMYFATELFYIRTTERLKSSSFADVQRTTSTGFSTALYHRQKLGLNIKLGESRTFFDRITVQTYSGLGIAYRNIQYKDLADPVPRPYDPFSYLFRVHAEQGKTFLLQIPFGIKVGVRLD